ncbi:MAG: threonylcarbamoyl-AMP synthase [Ruminococcaceae bacterium]|nr:threonylcarbamoyl-AMP synthase [Oscillospiraceae bacterium]
MQTQHIKIHDISAQEADLRHAAQILKNGGLVVFPTETVYGLGGNATDAGAAKKIYAAKGRPSDNPLIIHIANPADAEQYAVTNETYFRLAKAFMPGPLTVILPRRECIPTETTGGLDTVAVRCPSHPVAKRLIELAGIPIAAPSANLSGKPSPTSAAHVAQDMDGRVDMILDGGSCEIGLESTIVKIDGDRLTLLRPGGITYDALCMVCEHVTIADAVTHKLADGERPLSPGMKYRHYAPTAPLVLLDGTPEHVIRFLRAEQELGNCAILCYDEELPYLREHHLFPVGERADLQMQAHLLFSALRHADATDAEIIYAHLPPQEGLGLALYNRMLRAAAHTVKHVE